MCQSEGSRSAHPAPRGRGPGDRRVLLASPRGTREAKCPAVCVRACVCACVRVWEGGSTHGICPFIRKPDTGRNRPPQAPSAETRPIDGLVQPVRERRGGGPGSPEPLGPGAAKHFQTMCLKAAPCLPSAAYRRGLPPANPAGLWQLPRLTKSTTSPVSMCPRWRVCVPLRVRLRPRAEHPCPALSGSTGWEAFLGRSFIFCVKSCGGDDILTHNSTSRTSH